MRISTRARYSLRMMMAIARLSREGAPVGLREVAEHTGLSHRYLEQLIAPLRNASLVRAHPGRGGGYTLQRGPGEIRLHDVVTAAIGRIVLTDCVLDPDACAHVGDCNCCALWSRINDEIVGILESHTLADMLRDDWPALIAAGSNQKR